MAGKTVGEVCQLRLNLKFYINWSLSRAYYLSQMFCERLAYLRRRKGGIFLFHQNEAQEQRKMIDFEGICSILKFSSSVID